MKKPNKFPPCPECGCERVGKIQYGYSERDTEYRCANGHTWDDYPSNP